MLRIKRDPYNEKCREFEAPNDKLSTYIVLRITLRIVNFANLAIKVFRRFTKYFIE